MMFIGVHGCQRTQLAYKSSQMDDVPSTQVLEDWLRRKYVVRRSRGIDYLEASVDDLAKEIRDFIAFWRHSNMES